MKNLILASAFLVATVAATTFTDCGSEAINVLLSVDGCDTPPCVVERGNTYGANITFTADHVISNLTAAVTANLGGIDVPWPGLDRDACAHLLTGETCPIAANTPTTWTVSINVLNAYPTVAAVAKFRLFDESDHDDVCLQVDVVIV